MALIEFSGLGGRYLQLRIGETQFGEGNRFSLTELSNGRLSVLSSIEKVTTASGNDVLTLLASSGAWFEKIVRIDGDSGKDTVDISSWSREWWCWILAYKSE